MSLTEPSRVKRNRIIAIAAGVITVAAITLALASGYLGLTWLWLRPAAELLLLAELVGLIVLERHQLFEPVHQTVDGTHTLVQEMHALMTETAQSAGQVIACANTPEIYRATGRIVREALARDQQAPKILRIGRFAGRVLMPEDPGVTEWRGEVLDNVAAYFVTPSMPPDARARRWSVRWLVAFADLQNFDMNMDRLFRPRLGGKPSNFELKVLVRPSVDAALSPAAITDRDATVVFDDANASFQWGFWYQGAHHLALLERWFDDLWSRPESYVVYSRNGLNQSAIDRIRKELAAIAT